MEDVLSGVVYDKPIQGQADADEAVRVDQLRGHILERINGIREMAALRKRHLAEAGKCRQRLDEDQGLDRWDRIEIEGLAELRESQADYCAAMVGHFTLSIRTFYQMLK